VSSSVTAKTSMAQVMASARLRLRLLRIVAEQSPGRRRIRIAVYGAAAGPLAPGPAVGSSRR
jgi:hypothetical protein